jgi:uncharacterized protein
MGFQSLSLADRGLFEEFLGLRAHELSVYSFANIYIWRSLFDIRWQIIDNNLCVFFLDRHSCFLYLPPLGVNLSPQAAEEAFKFMDSRNKNCAVSRLENVEEKDAAFLKDLGYRISSKSGEYLCLRNSLVGLKGDGFKAKRACVNFFLKHYEHRYLEFSPAMKRDCLGLYELWAGERSLANSDKVYRGMLKDGFFCLKEILAGYSKLGLVARVAEINGKIKAFTAGFQISPETFCVLCEFADLSVKGISQYIFRSFCQELKDYKYINIMDDSGLKNLKAVKESYRPARLIPAFIADRKNG